VSGVEKMNAPLPHIAILTATRGRKRHLEFQIEQIRACNYPAESITWIVTDTVCEQDGWADIQRLYEGRVIYRSLEPGTPLGRSRNIGIELALDMTDAEYFFIMDDDDIICPGRFLHGVYAFKANPGYDVIGCSEVLIYNIRTRALMQSKRFFENHTLEPVTAVTRGYCAAGNRFDDRDMRGRFPPFLRDWKTPVYQMPAKQNCIIIGHDSNTCDKYQIESQTDRFGIVDTSYVDLKDVYELIGVSKPHMHALFERAYEAELREADEAEKRAILLRALDEQRRLDSTFIGYATIRKYIEENNINDVKCIRECLDKMMDM
jgi:glycosyltransferase involved in cell wall biosynthesis